MKVLFDEDVPRKLARSLPQHEPYRGQYAVGRRQNGALLTLIERDRFDVFLTGDKNMDKQQRLEGRPFAVLIMSAINWPAIRSHIQKISKALDEAQPGTVKTIDCGVFIARLKRPSE